MQAMDGVRELEALSAVIYSSNFGLGDSSSSPPHGLQEQLDVAKETAAAENDNDENTKPEPIAPQSIPGGRVWNIFDSVWARVAGS